MKKIQKSLKEKKSILWIIIFTLLLLFIGAPLFNAIATNKWSLNFINENNYDAWIGYYGSVLGGALTLGGVWWTIDKQNKDRHEDDLKHIQERKEELEILYKPVLTFPVRYSQATILIPAAHSYSFILKNKGRGEVNNIKISYSSKDAIIILEEDYQHFLAIDDVTTMKFFISHQTNNIVNNCAKMDKTIKDNDKFNISFEISYEGIFGNTYKIKFDVKIEKVFLYTNQSNTIEKTAENSAWFAKIDHIHYS